MHPIIALNILLLFSVTLNPRIANVDLLLITKFAGRWQILNSQNFAQFADQKFYVDFLFYNFKLITEKWCMWYEARSICQHHSQVYGPLTSWSSESELYSIHLLADIHCTTTITAERRDEMNKQRSPLGGEVNYKGISHRGYQIRSHGNLTPIIRDYCAKLLTYQNCLLTFYWAGHVNIVTVISRLLL